jgi:magnesium transporter
MLRTYFLAADGTLLKNLDRMSLRQALESRKGVLWVDLEDPLPEEVEILGPAVFDFHPLAIEDCLQSQSRPKIDDYDDYLYLVFHAWKKEPTSEEEGGPGRVRLEEVDFFLGKNYVVSYHVEPRASRSALADKVEKDARLVLGHGSDMLLHQILDLMVDKYTVVVDTVDDRVDDLELEILESPTDETLKKILVLKKDLQELFRTIRHQRDVMSSLCREGHPMISKKARTFFRDVYDHVVRVHDTVEGLRDEVAGARDAYLSMISVRMNSVMKGLSLVATIILPLTFVTGIYGMNFAHMPLLEHPAGFWLTCGMMTGLGGLMYAWFRKQGWT